MRSQRQRMARFTGGFSLIEVLVAVLIMVIVIVGMLAMFDRSVKMTKTESSVTDAQQSLRYGSYQLVREVRMAGAGAVPASTAVGSVHQLGVSLNLGSSTWGTGFPSNSVNTSADTVFIGGTHHVRVGTDLLHVRGIITNAVYDLGTSSWTPPVVGNTTGTLVIQPCTKFSDPTSLSTQPCYPNGANDMSAFDSTQTNRLFVMSDILGNVGVGLVTNVSVVKLVSSSACSVEKNCTATLTINVGSTTANLTYPQTLCPNGLFPSGLVTPQRGGILDDRVYFIDDGTTTATNCNQASAKSLQDQMPGPCHPVLSYADWATGDSSAAPFSTASVTQVAEDIEDLQVAYGMDFYDTTATNSVTSASTCSDYPSLGTACSLTNPAPTRTSLITGASLDYPSDASISITSKTALATLVASLQGSSTPNQDSTEDTSAVWHDEWVGNVTAEIAAGSTTFYYLTDLSLLKALEISLLAKGSQPDPAGRTPTGGPAYLGAFSWPLMDSAASTVSQPTSGTAFPYRRRASTVRVGLRNFQIQ